jgi:hypothetical protein
VRRQREAEDHLRATILRIRPGSARWIAARSMRSGGGRGIIPPVWHRCQLIVGDSGGGMTGIAAVESAVRAAAAAATCR